MAILDLSRVAPGVTDRLVVLITTDGFTQLGTPPRVYTPDTVPDQPVEPYAVVQRTETGYGWDEGLSGAGECGWVGLAVTGVGRMIESADWVLDVVRSYLRALDPATVTTTGDTHVKTVQSSGPPSPPFQAGTVWNVVENYELYVEAS